MSIKKWEEIQPLACEVCKCCKYTKHYYDLDTLEYKKYKKTVQSGFIYGCDINNYNYEQLFDICKCKKSYPTISKKFDFILKKIHYYKDCLDKHIEDIKYHRFDD